jgi:hypothetical protein
MRNGPAGGASVLKTNTGENTLVPARFFEFTLQYIVIPFGSWGEAYEVPVIVESLINSVSNPASMASCNRYDVARGDAFQVNV